MNSQQRRERLNELQTKRVAIPTVAYTAIENDVLPTELRSWEWSSYLWDRPSRQNWPYSEHDLGVAQEAWDTSHAFVTGRMELEAERKAELAAQQAERDAAFEAGKKAREAELTEHLRRVYLSQPATTEAGFQEALPALLEQRAREATMTASVSVASPISRRQILS